MISVIIPTFNEESSLEALLADLRAQPVETEVIVADGSSTDATVAIAARYACVVESERRRGRQLNLAARVARGEILFFLHADVRLPGNALAALARAMEEPEVVGGTFSLEFAGNGWPARIFTGINRWRRRLGIFYGDQGIFVRRAVFERMGGFREWLLLEDYEFARRLVKAGKTVCLEERLRVSSRRWEAGRDGRSRLWRTLATWFFLMSFYFLGVPPERLARWYLPIRSSVGPIPPAESAARRGVR